MPVSHRVAENVFYLSYCDYMLCYIFSNSCKVYIAISTADGNN